MLAPNFSIQRLKYLIGRKFPEPNLSKISQEIGCRSNYLSNLLGSEQSENTRGGPRILPMARLASLLGVSVEEMLGVPDIHTDHTGEDIYALTMSARVENSRAQSNLVSKKAPTIQGLMFRYHSSGGDYAAFEEFDQYFDLYVGPTGEDTDIEATHVGEYSMAGITMRETNPETLSVAVNNSSAALRAKLIADFRFAKKKGPQATIESLNVKMSNRSIRAKHDYMRFMAYFACNDRILTYAVPLF